VDEILDQVEQAVARPDLLPQVGGGKAAPGGRVAGAQVIALVEGDEAGLFAFQMGGKENQLGVYGKVRQAAPVGKEGFAVVAGGAVLPDGVFNRLAVEGVLEFGGKDGQAVEEDCQVQAVFAGVAVFELAHHAEDVALVLALNVRVEAAGGGKISQLEFAAQVFDALAQHMQGAVLADLFAEAL